MSILLRNSHIEEYERALDWIGALKYCLREWEKDINEVASQMRLITEAWYLLSYWEQIDHVVDGRCVSWFDCMVPLDYSFLYSVIHQTQDAENKLHLNNPKYLCVTGYLMKIQPEWFVGGKYTDLYECEQEGINRILRVPLTSDDECALFRRIVLDGLCIDEERTKSMFPGESKVDLYFSSILANRR